MPMKSYYLSVHEWMCYRCVAVFMEVQRHGRVKELACVLSYEHKLMFMSALPQSILSWRSL